MFQYESKIELIDAHIYKTTHGNYTAFQEVANSNDLLEGIDNAPTMDDDKSYELAQSLWLEVMSTMNDSEDMISSFIDYLELIKSRTKGFVYRLASLEDDVAGEPGRTNTSWGYLANCHHEVQL